MMLVNHTSRNNERVFVRHYLMIAFPWGRRRGGGGGWERGIMGGNQVILTLSLPLTLLYPSPLHDRIYLPPPLMQMSLINEQAGTIH